MMTEAQACTRALYAWLDEKSDGDLPAFASKIDELSHKERLHLFRTWPRQTPLPSPLAKGEIRPFVHVAGDRARTVAIALRLLLYAPSVSLNARLTTPTDTRPPPSKSKAWMDLPPARPVVERLAVMRPLVEDGSIQFVLPFIGVGEGRQRRDRDALREVLLSALRSDATQGLSEEEVLQTATRLLSSFFAISKGHSTALALKRTDDWAFRSLYPGYRIDGRAVRLSTLASLTVPDFSLNGRSLVALRNANEFAEWRTALDHSLGLVMGIPDGQEQLDHASGIVADSVMGQLRSLEKAAKASPSLAFARSAGRRLSFAAVGASAGALTLGTMGMPVLGALAGGVSGGMLGAIEAVRDSLAIARERNKAMAVWDVVTSFRDTAHSSRESGRLGDDVR